jgi:hypothetical protein
MLIPPFTLRYPQNLNPLYLDFTDTTKAIDPRITFSRASSATYFDSAGVLQTAGTGVARAYAFQDYNPSTLSALGFLIEEQRTNLSTYSEEFDNAAWTKTRSTVTANAATAPSGSVTADKIISNTANDSHFARCANVVSVSGTFCGSCFVKAAEFGYAFIGISDLATGEASVRINLSTGVVDTTNVAGVGSWTSISGTARQCASGWWRVQVVATQGAGAAVSMLVYAGNNAGARVYVGDDASGVYVWGAQLEAGSFPTSYIATTTAAATRLADSASITGGNFSGWWNATEGTFVLVGDYSYIATNGNGLLRCDDGSELERIMHRLESSTQRFTVIDNNVEQCDISRSGVVAGAVFKQATAYKLNDFASCINGGTVGTDAAGTIPTVDRMRFSGAINANYPNGHIQRLSYYRSRLANATLQSLST